MKKTDLKVEPLTLMNLYHNFKNAVSKNNYFLAKKFLEELKKIKDGEDVYQELLPELKKIEKKVEIVNFKEESEEEKAEKILLTINNIEQFLKDKYFDLAEEEIKNLESLASKKLAEIYLKKTREIKEKSKNKEKIKNFETYTKEYQEILGLISEDFIKAQNLLNENIDKLKKDEYEYLLSLLEKKEKENHQKCLQEDLEIIDKIYFCLSKNKLQEAKNLLRKINLSEKKEKIKTEIKNFEKKVNLKKYEKDFFSSLEKRDFKQAEKEIKNLEKIFVDTKFYKDLLHKKRFNNQALLDKLEEKFVNKSADFKKYLFKNKKYLAKDIFNDYFNKYNFFYYSDNFSSENLEEKKLEIFFLSDYCKNEIFEQKNFKDKDFLFWQKEILKQKKAQIIEKENFLKIQKFKTEFLDNFPHNKQKIIKLLNSAKFFLKKEFRDFLLFAWSENKFIDEINSLIYKNKFLEAETKINHNKKISNLTKEYLLFNIYEKEYLRRKELDLNSIKNLEDSLKKMIEKADFSTVFIKKQSLLEKKHRLEYLESKVFLQKQKYLFYLKQAKLFLEKKQLKNLSWVLVEFYLEHMFLNSFKDNNNFELKIDSLKINQAFFNNDFKFLRKEFRKIVKAKDFLLAAEFLVKILKKELSYFEKLKDFNQKDLDQKINKFLKEEDFIALKEYLLRYSGFIKKEKLDLLDNKIKEKFKRDFFKFLFNKDIKNSQYNFFLLDKYYPKTALEVKDYVLEKSKIKSDLLNNIFKIFPDTYFNFSEEILIIFLSALKKEDLLEDSFSEQVSLKKRGAYLLADYLKNRKNVLINSFYFNKFLNKTLNYYLINKNFKKILFLIKKYGIYFNFNDLIRLKSNFNDFFNKTDNNNLFLLKSFSQARSNKEKEDFILNLKTEDFNNELKDKVLALIKDEDYFINKKIKPLNFNIDNLNQEKIKNLFFIADFSKFKTYLTTLKKEYLAVNFAETWKEIIDYCLGLLNEEIIKNKKESYQLFENNKFEKSQELLLKNQELNKFLNELNNEKLKITYFEKLKQVSLSYNVSLSQIEVLYLDFIKKFKTEDKFVYEFFVKNFLKILDSKDQYKLLSKKQLQFFQDKEKILNKINKIQETIDNFSLKEALEENKTLFKLNFKKAVDFHFQIKNKQKNLEIELISNFLKDLNFHLEKKEFLKVLDKIKILESKLNSTLDIYKKIPDYFDFLKKLVEILPSNFIEDFKKVSVRLDYYYNNLQKLKELDISFYNKQKKYLQELIFNQDKKSVSNYLKSLKIIKIEDIDYFYKKYIYTFLKK
jgi:hypothetical protein